MAQGICPQWSAHTIVTDVDVDDYLNYWLSEGATMSRFQGEERIVQLLQHLGLDQAHFAARLDTDWTDLVAPPPRD